MMTENREVARRRYRAKLKAVKAERGTPEVVDRTKKTERASQARPIVEKG